MGLVAFMVVAVGIIGRVSATQNRAARSEAVYSRTGREAINYLLTSAMSREN
jgi:hypothetical protein